MENLKQFIREGGAYLGICGGGYLASSGWEEKDGFRTAMGLVPFASDSYLADSGAQIINIQWKDKSVPFIINSGPNSVAARYLRKCNRPI